MVKAARHDLGRTLVVLAELVPFQQIDVDAKESGFVQMMLISAHM